MAEKLTLDLVTPYRKVLSLDVDEITAPGSLGELGLLPGHTPLLTTLKIGELSYKQNGKTSFIAVNWGYLEVAEDRVTILVDTAEKADEIDLERAKAALGRAEDALKKLPLDDVNYRVMEIALKRAIIRIQVSGRR